ncbi:MAG TPA: four helix bundle protein [Syntrophorhabdaceae bacterium]|nr:four helix bundle protein [Syntrophorhabdaceae bacterium]
MTVQNFEDLQIWQEARKLTNSVYEVTKLPTFANDFGLINQIRRASISIGSNIAEGYERGGNQELMQFLSVAKGSSGEVRSQLYLALDLGYVEKEECEKLIDEFKKLTAMINSFIKYLKKTSYKGMKYKTN